MAGFGSKTRLVRPWLTASFENVTSRGKGHG